jgi:hypothetical protein
MSVCVASATPVPLCTRRTWLCKYATAASTCEKILRAVGSDRRRCRSIQSKRSRE